MAVLDNDDRRKHTRVGFTTEIQIILQIHKKQIILEGNSRDLSLKGIFVRTDKLFSRGTICSVKIYLTGGIEKIELLIQGTIARETEAGIGITFTAMDVETYSHLKNIVQYNSIDD
jgi:hypothetical protein